jgi:type II secretory pathway component PulJ
MEMLVVCSLITVVLAIHSRSFRELAVEMPRMHRDFQSNVSLQDMLRQLRKDVERSTSLSVYADDRESEQNGEVDDLLMVELDGTAISYEFAKEQIIRSTIDTNTDLPVGEEEIWPTPHAQIKWQLWRRDGKGYAVEIATAIRREVLGIWETKLRNSHVYFAGITAKPWREE